MILRLDDPETLAARIARLNASHIAPLEKWREALFQGTRSVPHFDPADGGADARILLLLETPGPGTAAIRFVSRDNPSGTARNLRRFLGEAAISRADTVLWNTVPWIVHASGARNRALRRGEIGEGLRCIAPLLKRLPKIETVLLAGRIAALVKPLVLDLRPDLHIVTMPHPSPTYVCTSPDIPRRIAATLNDVAESIQTTASREGGTSS